MAVQSAEPVIRAEALAAGADISLNALYRGLRQGRIPPSDSLVRSNGGPACAWKLSTIRAWDPAVAARCAALVDALEKTPLKAA